MTRAQEAINRIQNEILGSDPSNEEITEYANACINSALGAVAVKTGDIGAYGVLYIWMETVKARLSAKEGYAP